MENMTDALIHLRNLRRQLNGSNSSSLNPERHPLHISINAVVTLLERHPNLASQHVSPASFVSTPKPSNTGKAQCTEVSETPMSFPDEPKKLGKWRPIQRQRLLDKSAIHNNSTGTRVLRLTRRASGEIETILAAHRRRHESARRRLRRRRSLNEEAMLQLELQREQFSVFRDYGGTRSHPALLRRTRSAVVCIYDLSGQRNHPLSLGLETSDRSILLRKVSLSSFGPGFLGNEESWPETITGLITGGQMLLERVGLFSELEQIMLATQDAANQKPRLKLLSKGVSIPSPDKKRGGEDSFFVTSSSVNFVGVADGVGEWGELGCNPRQFADQLMIGSKRAAERLSMEGFPVGVSASRIAQRILECGYSHATAFGSSTSIVVGLNSTTSQIGIANIGDSSCLILRRDLRKHGNFLAFRRTKEQQHYFNCPYQLSRVPKLCDLESFASTKMFEIISLSLGVEGDTPDVAELYDVSVQEGDLIIVATDGVFDNLFDREIAALASMAISPKEAKYLEDAGYLPDSSRWNMEDSADSTILPPMVHEEYGLATPPEGLAQALAEAALYRSLDTRASTPFARQARKAGGFFTGGKADDISVVAAWVVRDP